MAIDRRYPRQWLAIGLMLLPMLGACGGGFDDVGVDPAFGADEAQAPLDTVAGAAPVIEAAPAAAAVAPASGSPTDAGTAGPAGRVRCADQRLGAVRTGAIVVPAGSACRLDGTLVAGSIEIEPGARLVAHDIDLQAGELRARGAAQVVVAGRARIGGSVQVSGGGEVEVSGARIQGDLRLDDQAGAVLAHGNEVGGNLLAAGNRGGLTILGNRVAGQLRCEANAPEPMGGGNASAFADGQCRRL
jgi:hypothetical protein